MNFTWQLYHNNFGCNTEKLNCVVFLRKQISLINDFNLIPFIKKGFLWRPVQCVPRLSHKDNWKRLQHPVTLIRNSS